MNAPIFVLGNPRSGTTILRLMLTCHPALCIPPECGFVQWLEPRWGSWSWPEDGAPQIRAFVRDLLETKKFDTWGMREADLIAAIVRAQPTNYADLCASVYKAYASSRDKAGATWGDKNNYYTNHVPLLARLFPAARFLLIVRDGRDVACSYLQVMLERPLGAYAPRLPVDPADIAKDWCSNNAAALEALAALTPERCERVRYEDLMRNPRAELSRLCSWLKLPLHDAMLAPHEANRLNRLEPAETMAWKRRTLDAPDTSKIGRYAKDLQPEDLRAFEEVARPMLDRLGYDASGGS